MDNSHSVKEELKHEFQLERMILFSDAVFAIVITLMAIELKAPSISSGETSTEIIHKLLHLMPEFLAYIISFLFIGVTWYKHLKMFSIVKNYDKGLVIRNLLMLFFISLFPFSASLNSKSGNTLIIPMVVYFSILILCILSQLFLNYYLLYQHPELCYKTHIQERKISFKSSKFSIFLLVGFLGLVIVTYNIIPEEEYKGFAWFWFFIFPFLQKKIERKIKTNAIKTNVLKTEK